MAGRDKDIDPASELVEDDEEQALPDSEELELDVVEAAGPLGGRSRGAVAPRQARAVGARRLSHARCRRRGALRRQGEEHQEADHVLHAADRPRHAHRAGDRGDRGGGVRHHRDRDRGAAARSQPDQAPAAALQRAAARRQVVSLHHHHLGPLGAADPQAPRRALAPGQLLRAVRLGVGGQPHHHGAAARVPAALLLGRLFRKPHAAVPAASDQALLGALHPGDRFRRIRRAGARGQRVPVRQEPGGARRAVRRNGEGLGRARFRARRDLPRPPRRAVGDAVDAGHQSAQHRGGRRVRHPSGGRLQRHRGVLLPHRAELGQPRLFPQGRPDARAGRGAGRVPGAVLRRQAVSRRHPAVARHSGARTAGRGAEHQDRPQGRGLGAAARREEGTGGARAGQRARGAGPQARRHLVAAEAAQGAGRDVRAAARAAPHRGLRQQPHPGLERGRRHDRRRARRASRRTSIASSTSAPPNSRRATTSA